jgi:amidase
MSLSPELKEIARKKRAAQYESIPAEWRLKSIPNFTNANEAIPNCGILTAQDLAITAIDDARILRDKMLAKELSCVDVTTAFCKRAAVAQQLIGCCTEMMFERALKRAKELDEHLARTGEGVGMLHGVPVSVKDSFEVEGVDTTIGT